MKIYVYAICRNEEKFVNRWVESMSEADGIIVLDTGSDDNTVKLLSVYPKVTVYSEKIEPWRFDTARNRSLELVPEDADICVCTDLDEVFRKGWRKGFEQAFADGVQLFSYRYTWSFTDDGREGTVFNIQKAHSRYGFEWKHPVHEVVTYTGEGLPVTAYAKDVQIDHHPDNEKPRGQYLPLLELSVKEDPTDDRNMHYLGREYMFAGRYREAIDTLIRHLALPTATWKDERCASMRYIAKCFDNMGNSADAEIWFMRACAEAPYLREPWMDFAMFCYRNERWYPVIALTKRALTLTERPLNYMSEAAAWNELPYDLLSFACYKIGDNKNALKYVDKAIKISPADERLRRNRIYFSKI